MIIINKLRAINYPILSAFNKIIKPFNSLSSKSGEPRFAFIFFFIIFFFFLFFVSHAVNIVNIDRDKENISVESSLTEKSQKSPNKNLNNEIIKKPIIQLQKKDEEKSFGYLKNIILFVLISLIVFVIFNVAVVGNANSSFVFPSVILIGVLFVILKFII